MISPTRTSHASGLPISSRDSTRVENVVPSPAAPAPAPLPAAEPCAPSPAEHPESPSADSAATPASAAKPRRDMFGYAISNPPFEGKGFTGEMRKRHGANSTARPNAVANPLPASTACRSKRHHARDNESGQAQAAALINAAQTPRFNKTPRQSRFYTRLTSLVKHGEFVSDLCYHQATSQEKFHTGNHLRNSHPIQRCWDKGAIPLSHSFHAENPMPPPALQQVRQTHTSLTWAIHDWHGLTCLFYTRLARSQLCRSYTKGTVNEFKLF